MADGLRLSREALAAPFVGKVEELSGQNLSACYQCGKCAAGCLFTEHMDALPNQVLRRVQLGDESVLAASAPWACASCLACAVRCPKGVDVARVMEALRLLALRRGLPHLDPRATAGVPQIALVGAYRKLTP
ncbi:4Fe-4S dicluster domain-containing protein [Candidatus Bipolaricaulota bacterium]|nr:4Fe-4S dicluster domain-containing protein [Candidatus Bipolaricaulota bacterium]